MNVALPLCHQTPMYKEREPHQGYVQELAQAAREVNIMAHGHLEGTYMLLFDPATLFLWPTIEHYKSSCRRCRVADIHSESRACSPLAHFWKIVAKLRHTAVKTLSTGVGT